MLISVSVFAACGSTSPHLKLIAINTLKFGAELIADRNQFWESWDSYVWMHFESLGGIYLLPSVSQGIIHRLELAVLIKNNTNTEHL